MAGPGQQGSNDDTQWWCRGQGGSDLDKLSTRLLLQPLSAPGAARHFLSSRGCNAVLEEARAVIHNKGNYISCTMVSNTAGRGLSW